MTTYSEFKSKSSSGKKTLVKIEGSIRLIGWELYSGSIYKISNNGAVIIVNIEDSGTAYTEVSGISEISASKFYNDTANGYIYLQASDSSNPNSRIIVLTQWYFFSDGGAILPYDLSSGEEVNWLPMIEETSEFGVNLDNSDPVQLGVAIEGSGSVTFLNDQSFWMSRFDRVTWDNRRVFIYSIGNNMAASQAQLIYRGRVQSKSYSSEKIVFNLKDLINELRGVIELDTIGDISGAYVPDGLLDAKQRLLYGYQQGFRPTNIDQILDGRTLSGTVSTVAGSATLTGSGTSFLTYFSPDDNILITGYDEELTVATIDSDTQITLSDESPVSLAARTYQIIPTETIRHFNRNWVLSGHALREPTTTVTSAVNTSLFTVTDITDFEIGNTIIVGTEITTIKRLVTGNQIKLNTALAIPPTVGTTVKRLTVYPVYLNKKELTYLRDYTYVATTGRLTLDPLAEFNIAPTLKMLGTVTFNNASRTITGSGTIFSSQLKPGAWVRLLTQSNWYEVLSIESDTSATLRAIPSYSGSGTTLYKYPKYYEEGEDVISCTILGATENGLTSGTWIKTGPQIVKDLLTRADLSSLIDTTSFATAKELGHQLIGLSIPETYSNTKTPKYREAIDKVNKSIFGALIQTTDFELAYEILSPGRTSTSTRIREHDAISFRITSKGDKISKSVTIEYQFHEYDYEIKDDSYRYETASSIDGTYLAKSNREQIVTTILQNQEDAQLFAARWAFLLGLSQNIIKLRTKLQTIDLGVIDRIDFSHSKLYQRLGVMDSRKIGSIMAANKSAYGVSLEIEDLANAFSRCGTWTSSTANEYDAADEDEKIINGYWTDSYGMQGNDPDTFGVNLWW